jgi:hypothetical protein
MKNNIKVYSQTDITSLLPSVQKRIVIVSKREIINVTEISKRYTRHQEKILQIQRSFLQ